MAVKTYGSVYTDGCGSNSVSVSSPLRRVPQFFSGSTGVLSGKDWSPFRRGLGKFPYASPGFCSVLNLVDRLIIKIPFRFTP